MSTLNNKYILLYLIISVLLCTVSCAKHSASSSAPAHEIYPTTAVKKNSPMEDYIIKFVNSVRQYWAFTMRLSLPTTCSVDIDISPTGEILSYQLTISSGNKYFDNSALNAVTRAKKESSLPPPPEPISKGMTIVFSLPKSTY